MNAINVVIDGVTNGVTDHVFLMMLLNQIEYNVKTKFRGLLHLRPNVITFRTLLHLGTFITFRPSTQVFKF